MYTGSGDSMVKETLKSLSCNNGWSYGVFWRFDQRNSSLLTLQEAHYEEQMGVLIDDMILQVHILGGGVIGQVAFTKKHRWMLTDAHFITPSPAGSVESSDIFQEHSELEHQFSIGIKTIAVISVESLGVVQFGSTEKLPERLEFVNQTRERFQEIEIVQGLILPEREQSSSNIDTCDSIGLFTSLLSSKDPHFGSPNLEHSDNCNDLVKMSCSAANLSQSFPSSSDFQNMNVPVTAASLCGNRFRIANAESQFYSDVGVSDILLQQSLPEPSTFFDFSSSEGPCNSPWNFGDIQESSILNSGCSYGLFADAKKTFQNCSTDIFNCPNFGSSLHSSAGQVQSTTTLNTFEQLLGNNDSTNALPKYCAMEDASPWFAPIADQNNGMVATTLSSDLSNESGDFSSSSYSCPNGYHTPTKIISDNQSSTSVQSSITNSFDFAEKEKCSDMFGSGKVFEGPGMNLGSKSSQDWKYILMPDVSGGHLNFSSSKSECVSELYASRRIDTTNTLFSKLGLYQHFDGIAGDTFSVARSNDHLSSTAKRRKIESSLISSNQVKCLPGFAGNTNPAYPLTKTNHFESKSEVRTLGAHSCFGDSSSVIDGCTISSPKHQEPAKTKKKRAKPGTKQKSKDRVLIAARLADLRELIPSGEKMSIDRLLHRTIKHLLFLQSVTRHAENFEQSDEPKIGMVQKEKASNRNGVTWACEVGNETMFCPLIVEDLSIPGQMLIEILCEEQGFFLEIVDIIRGFGLTILKGVMEVRETKLWAQFTVEAEENQQITRHEVFSSLVQLLQLAGPTEVQKSAELVNTMGGGAGLFNNCQQSCVPLPVSLGNKSF